MTRITKVWFLQLWDQLYFPNFSSVDPFPSSSVPPRVLGTNFASTPTLPVERLEVLRVLFDIVSTNFNWYPVLEISASYGFSIPSERISRPTSVTTWLPTGVVLSWPGISLRALNPLLAIITLPSSPIIQTSQYNNLVFDSRFQSFTHH